jgi:conserved oligomeric Golgi complex subunit 8
VIATSNALSTLREQLPALTSAASSLRDGVPELDKEAFSFSQKYSKSNTENTVLDRRKKAMLLSRNVDRVSDILELPTLLATAIASSSSSASFSASAPAFASTPSSVNYSQALDLFAHIKRLQILHPDSALIQSVLEEAEEAMKDMTSNLIISLRSQNIRLAAAIRTIGWLKRVAPELAIQSIPLPSAKPTQNSTPPSSRSSLQSNSDGSFGYLFLACRLYNLVNMLEALAPLRDLADQETQHRLQRQNNTVVTGPSSDQSGGQRKHSSYSHNHSAFTGQQTERYLKRYIEIFREQSVATISMYKNIFPATNSDATATATKSNTKSNSTPSANASTTADSAPAFPPLPTPLATFPSHLISLLSSTLQQYLPNLSDPSARDSLLMQVLYAAGSLGRHGADFSMILASLLDDSEDDDEDDDEAEEGHLKNEMIKDAEESHELDKRTTQAVAAMEKHDDNNNENNDDDELKTNDIDISHHPPHEKEIDQVPSPNPARIPTSKLKHKVKALSKNDTPVPTPEWIRIMHKHRLQSSKLDALSSSTSSHFSSSPPLPTATSSPHDAVAR